MILLQINFKFPVEMMGESLSTDALPLAYSINQEPGFISKIWIENTNTADSGGIYLFEDRESAQKYVEKHTPRVKAMGATEIECKFFSVNAALSTVNHGIK